MPPIFSQKCPDSTDTAHDRAWKWLAPVFFTGLASVVTDAYQPAQSISVDLRASFGVMAAANITLMLFMGARALAGSPALELCQYTRLVSRWVYILMYLLATVRMSLYLFEMHHTDAIRSVQQIVSPVRSLDDFQFYIACCVIPLWLVRAIILNVTFKERRTFPDPLRVRALNAPRSQLSIER
jgi:hypothetical protein